MKKAVKPAVPKAEPKSAEKPKKPHNPANNLGKFLHPAKKKVGKA